jgi:hypothetical protein
MDTARVPTENVIYFINFSSKTNYLAFMDIHRKFLTNRSEVVIGWDNTRGTIRLRGTRLAVSDFKGQIEIMRDALATVTREIIVDADCETLFSRYVVKKFGNTHAMAQKRGKRGQPIEFWVTIWSRDRNESAESIASAFDQFGFFRREYTGSTEQCSKLKTLAQEESTVIIENVSDEAVIIKGFNEEEIQNVIDRI